MTAAPVTWTDHDAVLFDLDGVLTPTAEVHRRAWAEMFDAFLGSWTGGGDTRPWSEQDYYDHVDGKPRYDGVRDFLTSRDIALPEGEPSDAPDAVTVCGLGNRKNDAFNAVLERDGEHVHDRVIQRFARSCRIHLLRIVRTGANHVVGVVRGMQDD